MSKGHSLQDPYLNALRKERIPVSIFLVNGIKLQGQVESFDQFVILPDGLQACDFHRCTCPECSHSPAEPGWRE